jgi:hypothetical protein
MTPIRPVNASSAVLAHPSSERSSRQLERYVWFYFAERGELDVDDRLSIGQRDLVDGDRMAPVAGSNLRHRVASGDVSGRAPVVRGELADGSVEGDRPGQLPLLIEERQRWN